MKKAFFLSCLLCVTLLSYQNCSQPVDGLENPSFSEFAFDAKLDTLAYMSCSNIVNTNPSAYFTFRAGGFGRKGGISLTKKFQESTREMSPIKRQDFLLRSKINTNIQPQISLRQVKGTGVLAKNDGGPKEGEAFSFVFPPVNDVKVLGRLLSIAEGEKVLAVEGAGGEDRKFVGSLDFSSSETLAKNVRGELGNKSILAMTYVPLDESGSALRSETTALGPTSFSSDASASSQSVFGVGLKIKFAQGNKGEGDPERVLSSVTELDLISKAENKGDWRCDDFLKFKIVRPQDANIIRDDGTTVVNCNEVEDPANPSTGLQRVREILSKDDWFVDMGNRCIIPKPRIAGICYRAQAVDIEYGDLGCGGDKVCTHFMSMCYRAN